MFAGVDEQTKHIYLPNPGLAPVEQGAQVALIYNGVVRSLHGLGGATCSLIGGWVKRRSGFHAATICRRVFLGGFPLIRRYFRFLKRNAMRTQKLSLHDASAGDPENVRKSK